MEPESGVVLEQQTEPKNRIERCATHTSEKNSAEEPPLNHAFWRVMRVILSNDAPIPELDALPMAQLRLIWAVFHSSNGTMKDFSDRLGVSQSTITQLAEKLVRRDLVERHADTQDRRVVRLQVSPVGQRLLGLANARSSKRMREFWEEMAPQDRPKVIQGLEILARTAEAVRATQGHPLPPWPNQFRPDGSTPAASENAQSQPVVDLMSRRVRGRTA